MDGVYDLLDQENDNGSTAKADLNQQLHLLFLVVNQSTKNQHHLIPLDGVHLRSNSRGSFHHLSQIEQAHLFLGQDASVSLPVRMRECHQLDEHLM